MTFKEWLKYAVKNRSTDIRQLLPELKLKDGTELSVQASEFHMCYPKEKLDDGEYLRVEVYTHGEKIEGLYGMYEPSSYTYGHVPIDFMEELCELHGGILMEE